MLTGELPFSGETSAELIYAILNRLPEAASQLNPDVSGELDHLMDRALAKDPEDRFQGMQELLAVLRRPSEAPLFDTSSQHMKRAASLPSIGVLPFADMSAENDQEYFCDGIAEEIINNLTHVEGVRVAARTSAFSFKDTPVSIQEIGRILRVETLLEGSVRKFKNRIRITSQLINVTDGFHLWSESYDRELEDIFSIQEEIANRIVQALRVQLTEREKKALQKAATLNVRAYDFYLRGRQYFYQSNKHGVEYAVRMFKKAIGQDPDYALAYAGLADCHSYLFMYYDASQANLESAKESSGKALELDPELAEAHAARGLAVGLTQEWEEAEKQFERAIDLNPNLFEAHYFYARIRFAQGQLAEAAKLFERASRVNPDDYQAASLQACALNSMDRHEEAAKAYGRNLKRIRRRLELNPDDSRALYLGSHALLETGEKQQAVEWAERAYAIGPDDPYTIYGLACFYAQIGDIERSLDTLEKAIEVGFAHRAWILNDGDLDPIRDHRRFKSLLDSLPGGDKAAGSGK
jgi:TolB-like protein/Flp pilus assembly protein TadD